MGQTKNSNNTSKRQKEFTTGSWASRHQAYSYITLIKKKHIFRWHLCLQFVNQPDFTGSNLHWQTCLWYNTMDYFLLEYSCETLTPLGRRFGFLKWITAYILKPPWSIQLLQGEILPRLIAQTWSLILCNVSEIARVALWRQHGMATPLFKLNMSIISAMSSAAGYVL